MSPAPLQSVAYRMIDRADIVELGNPILQLDELGLDLVGRLLQVSHGELAPIFYVGMSEGVRNITSSCGVNIVAGDIQDVVLAGLGDAEMRAQFPGGAGLQCSGCACRNGLALDDVDLG